MQSPPCAVEPTVDSPVIDLRIADASSIPPERRAALAGLIEQGALTLADEMKGCIEAFLRTGCMANEIFVYYEPPTVSLNSSGWLYFEQNFRVL